MNKVLFNEGGQPVFLDDLSSIQDYCSETAKMILSSLGVDIDSVFFVKKPSITRNGTLATFTPGVIWVKEYGLVPLKEATDIDLGVTGKAFVQLDVSKTTNHDFADGISRPTRLTVSARIVSMEAGSDYVFFGIGDMMSELASLIDITNKTNYQSVEVEWVNGYSGIVEVKAIYGGVRYHVKAKSSSVSEWADSTKTICYGSFIPSVSTMFMTGGDSPSRDTPHYLILSSEGNMALSKGGDMGPSFSSIDVTFDVLGNSFDS